MMELLSDSRYTRERQPEREIESESNRSCSMEHLSGMRFVYKAARPGCRTQSNERLACVRVHGFKQRQRKAAAGKRCRLQFETVWEPLCKVKFDRCILLGVRFNFGVRERRKERRKHFHSVQRTSYTTKSHQSRTMQAVHKTAQRSKWLLLLLSMLLNAVSTGSAKRGPEIVTGCGVVREAHGGLCFSISNLPPALRTQAIRQLQRGFSCGPRVAFSNFPLSVTVYCLVCVCVFVSVAGHERVCNGALTTAKLLPSFLAFLLVSLVRSLFSAF